MSTPPQDRDDRDVPPNTLEGVSVEPTFDYSWLSREPPGYADVDDDGQVVAPDVDHPS